MGNMIFNKRIEDALHSEANSKVEHRIFAEHMYKGPKKLGDPNYRGLSKMEEDPMIPQRQVIKGAQLRCVWRGE